MTGYQQALDGLSAAREALPDTEAGQARAAVDSVSRLLAEAGTGKYGTPIDRAGAGMLAVLEICAHLRRCFDDDIAGTRELSGPAWRAEARERKWLSAGRDPDPGLVFGRLMGPQVKGEFARRPLWRNKHGVLTDGHYTVNTAGQKVHRDDSEAADKSRFHATVDVDRLTLDAAQRADAAGLWTGADDERAKVEFTEVVGVHSRTGRPTTVVNLYRRKNKKTIHACPGSPT
ncbi:hypothetical protein [Allokutzneria oryzae]|uniref:Bacterial EndoU nuclease domain-containing protein n=1 Tax=Allokutzneria oryzae TaxID=1378989 RepID=A0ABV5ZS15_9PSEU